MRSYTRDRFVNAYTLGMMCTMASPIKWGLMGERLFNLPKSCMLSHNLHLKFLELMMETLRCLLKMCYSILHISKPWRAWQTQKSWPRSLSYAPSWCRSPSIQAYPSTWGYQIVHGGCTNLITWACCSYQVVSEMRVVELVLQARVVRDTWGSQSTLPTRWVKI